MSVKRQLWRFTGHLTDTSTRAKSGATLTAMRTSVKVACVAMLMVIGVLGYLLASLVQQPEGSSKKVTLLYREYQLRQDRMERYAQESNPIVERKQLQVEDERRVLALQLELLGLGLDLPYTARVTPRP